MAQLTQPEILAALAAHGPCSAKQLGVAMGVHAKRLGPSLTRLRDPHSQAGKRVYVVEWLRHETGQSYAVFAVGSEPCASPLPTNSGAVHSRRTDYTTQSLVVRSIFDLFSDRRALQAIAMTVPFVDPFKGLDEQPDFP